MILDWKAISTGTGGLGAHVTVPTRVPSSACRGCSRARLGNVSSSISSGWAKVNG